MDIEQITQIAEVLAQIAIIAAPIILSWYLKTYRKSVQNSQSEMELAAIVRLANTAIDYVEALDKGGSLEKVLQMLQLPVEIVNSSSKGVKKLALAGHWLENELRQAGIKITDEKAMEWVSAEFRKRVGDVRMGTTVAKHIQEAVTTIQQLEQSGLIGLSPTVDRLNQLAGLAADWAIAQLDQEGVQIPREEILTRVRAEYLKIQQDQSVDIDLPTGDRLTLLAEQALRFLDGRQIGNQLNQLSKKQLVAAWVLTEVVKQGLDAEPDEIAEAVDKILTQQQGIVSG